jgi:hypothetical protein
MKRYCYIIDNEIKKVEVLPIVWENVSNFYVLPDDILKTYGWLPLEEQTFNNTLSSGYHILPDKVIHVSEPPVINENIEQENIENLWREVRDKRDRLLQESDTFMLTDNYEQLSPEKQQQYKMYRQHLRDITETFQDPKNIIWPEIV